MSKLKALMPSLAALAARSIDVGEIREPVPGWRHISRQTLQNPAGSQPAELRAARKARRQRRMRLRLHRGRACAG